MPPSTRSDPQRSGIVRVTLPASRSISLTESLIALATNARRPSTTIAVGWMPTSTCRVAPVARSIRLTVPDAGAPRSSTTIVEVLALGRPVAGPRQPAAPVADDQRPLVVREPRLVRQGLDRVLADEPERRQVDLGDGVAVGRGDEQPRAVAGDRHPAGDGVALGPRGLDRDLGPGLELAILVGEGLDVALVGAGVELGAVGRPDQAAEPGRGLVSERDARPRRERQRRWPGRPRTCSGRRRPRPGDAAPGRSAGRVKAIEPPSIRCPEETRKLPSGWRPIQTGSSRDMPANNRSQSQQADQHVRSSIS